MTQHYNRSDTLEKRRRLRRDSTHCEKILWINLRGSAFGVKFRRQYSYDHFIVDFCAPSIKLAIEVDGSTHTSENARQKDLWRQQYIEKFGVTFLRFTDDEVSAELDRVLRTIEATIKRLLSKPDE